MIQTKSDSYNSRINSVFSWVMRASLRTKAIAFAFAVGTLPALGVGTLTYYLVNQSTTKEIINTKQDKANLLADSINRFILRRYKDIQILSKLTFLQNPKLKEVISREQIEARLSNYLDIENSYESIAVLDMNGDLIAEAKGQSIPNQKNQDYFQEVLKTNQLYISQPLTTKSVDKAEIYLAAPVNNVETGEIVYIIRTVVSVQSLAKTVLIPQIKQDDYDLVDASGKIFLFRTMHHAGKNAKENILQWKQLQAEKQIASRILFNNKKNAEELVIYKPLPRLEGLPDLKWKLVLSTTTATAFATQRQLLLGLQMGTVLTALLVGGSAAFFANRLMQPILAATIAVKKLGKGNFDTRIAIQGEDELATLGSNINYMADQLQDLVRKQTSEGEQLKSLTKILLSMSQSLNSEDLFNITVTEARQALLSDRVVIYHFNAPGDGQVIAESVAAGLPIALGTTIEDACIPLDVMEAYRNGRVLVTNNVLEAGFSPEHLRLMERLQIKANLVTPILKDHQVFGLLIAHHYLEHIWQPYEINFLRQLAIQVGLTLERVSLLENTQVLKELAIHLSGTLNSQELYNFAVKHIRQALKADRAIIYKFDENWQGSIIAESVLPDWPSAVGAEISDPCLKDYMEKYRQRRVLAINNIYQADLSDCYIQKLEPFAVKANLVVSIVLSNKVVGLLIAHQCSQPRLWQQSEIDLFEQFAAIVGLALERTNFLEQTEKGRQAAEVVSLQQSQQKEQLQMQLLRLIDHIEGASRGDLTLRAEVTNGEIGTVADFFNSIVESLQEIVNEVKLAATQVNVAVADNSGAIGKLAVKALKQAEEISRSLDSIDQMTFSIKAVAESAKQAAVVARTASRNAEIGGATMDLTVENILGLREMIGETTKKVKRLGESSQQISRVVALINQIALQTNLLAINIGIEAARAGEEGQGFAVIAEEVTVLASQSTAATSEIEQIVANIQLETSKVVKAMELGTAQVVEGTCLVENTKQSLSQIINVCPRIEELVESISTATISQVQTSKDVTVLMKEIAGVSEMTSNSFRQVSASLRTTVEISQKLQASVSNFKVS